MLRADNLDRMKQGSEPHTDRLLRDAMTLDPRYRIRVWSNT